MKKLFSALLLLSFTFGLFAQQTMETALQQLSADLARQLAEKKIGTAAVAFITNDQNQATKAGNYLADRLSAGLAHQGGLAVTDRDIVRRMISLPAGNTGDFDDPETVRGFGRQLSVGVILSGRYTLLHDTLNLVVNGHETTGGMPVAGAVSIIPLTPALRDYLGLSLPGQAPQNTVRSDVSASDTIRNSDQDPDCQSQNLGSYCFYNTTAFSLFVTVSGSGADRLLIEPGQSQCIYNLPVSAYDFVILDREYQLQYDYKPAYPNDWSKPKYESAGKIEVEKCKMKTMQIQ